MRSLLETMAKELTEEIAKRGEIIIIDPKGKWPERLEKLFSAPSDTGDGLEEAGVSSGDTTGGI